MRIHTCRDRLVLRPTTPRHAPASLRHPGKPLLLRSFVVIVFIPPPPAPLFPCLYQSGATVLVSSSLKQGQQVQLEQIYDSNKTGSKIRARGSSCSSSKRRNAFMCESRSQNLPPPPLPPHSAHVIACSIHEPSSWLRSAANATRLVSFL